MFHQQVKSIFHLNKETEGFADIPSEYISRAAETPALSNSNFAKLNQICMIRKCIGFSCVGIHPISMENSSAKYKYPKVLKTVLVYIYIQFTLS